MLQLLETQSRVLPQEGIRRSENEPLQILLASMPAGPLEAAPPTDTQAADVLRSL